MDLSGNTTPEKFTVDCTEATGTVKVGALGIWEKLLEKLTFGLWSPKAVDVTVPAEDPIAGVVLLTGAIVLVVLLKKKKKEEAK